MKTFLCLTLLTIHSTFAQSERLPLSPKETPFPTLYNVIWDKPGKLPSGSMPTGNGDLSINAWVEDGGDLLFYIGKNDTWSELERLLKVGRVRVKLKPNPFASGQPFRQELKLEDGSIVIRAGAPGNEVSIRLFADANRPVIRFESTSEKPLEVSASTEIWRTADRNLPVPERMSAWSDRDSALPLIESADVLVAGRDTDIIWYHRNVSSIWEGSLRLQGLENLISQQKDPLLNRTFGVVMRGPDFVAGENGTLKAPPSMRREFSLHVLTSVTDTSEEWQRELLALADKTDAIPTGKAWEEHQAWWSRFWARSHVIMSGPLIEAASAVITPVAVPLRIGSGDAGSPFLGKISSARIHGNALSASDIQSLASDRAGKPVHRDGLIAEWDLSKPDSKGNYPSQPAGSLTATRNGEIAADSTDSIAVFSGSGHLQIAHDPRLDPTDALTLEAWVFAQSQPEAGGRIFDKGLGGTDNGYILDTYPGNSLRLISKGGTLTAENVLPVGKWAHLAATLDGKDGMARLYVDGKMVAERQGAATSSSIQSAADIAQVYNLQRFLMAASSRGDFPPKFNGATFNVDYLATGGYNVDYRNWGGSYWFQNTRHLHWPNLADGDFDLMKPFFKLYLDTLELGRERTKVWYGHEGTFFPETMSFWGTHGNSDYGRNREGLKHGEVTNGAISLHLNGNLEFVAALLRYYLYTDDAVFARNTLVPAAKDLLLFWDQHYLRNDKGHLVLEPAQALEAYWNVVNPSCDIAGLTHVLDGLLALPSDLVDPSQQEAWKKLRGAVPPLPIRVAGGQEYLAVADKVTPAKGGESPELYSIHPFPLFGVGKPDLERAVRSYWERPNERPGTLGYNTCWSYLSTISARLGLAEEAAKLISSRAALFWGSRFFPDNMTNGDWIPDMDNTGSMAFSVQSMLLQTNGEKILLAPAWPKQWNADFKLHAPQNTVVSGTIRAGKLENLKVIPESRSKDVIDCLANPSVAR